jgi:hypothetical protein
MSETTDQLSEAFVPAAEEGTQDLAPIPAGRYTAQITDAIVKSFKSGKGQAVFLTWEIVDGEHQGRAIWQHCTLSHESEKAARFGRQKFKDVCSGCGIVDPVTDLSVLYSKPCEIWVGIEQDEAGEYPPKNKVGKVRPVGTTKDGNGAVKGKAPFNDEVPF